MNEIYKKRNLTTINEVKLLEFKNFRKNTFVHVEGGNIKFLESIKAILHKQTFEGGKPLLFKEYDTYKEPPIFHAPEDKKAVTDWKKRQQEGQQRLNVKIDKENELIRSLRNNYLHWNATYNITNFPNIVGGKRKRHIR